GWYTFSRSGKVLYAVVLGAFTTKEAAAEAARAATGASGAWVRTFRSINKIRDVR
ncbi:MAG: SPOR domain-containing protein, partial [Gammaproteobacteria bacterium]|nr:SPOR domain-containing protein [Gammaproteobacteria bacterium]